MTGIINPYIFGKNLFTSTLYTGTGASQSVSSIFQPDLVWLRNRSSSTVEHQAFDSTRGGSLVLSPGTTAANATPATTFAFTSTGFSLDGTAEKFNKASDLFSAWGWKKAVRYFDIVQYTGTGSAHTIAHSLGYTPEFMIIKRTDSSGDWAVYHIGTDVNIPEQKYLYLNASDARAASITYWNNTQPTSSVFSVGTNTRVNAVGGTYIAYLFCSNPGSSSFGSYFGTGSSGLSVTTGFRPEGIIIKKVGEDGSTAQWISWDKARGFSKSFSGFTSGSEQDAGGSPLISVSDTGFTLDTTDSSLNASTKYYLYSAWK